MADISSNLFNVCAFKNSIGEVLPKIYFKSQVEKLPFLIQALQSIKANKNYSSFKYTRAVFICSHAL